jgi:hypothetical protein
MRFIDETVKFVEERPAAALGIAGALRFLGFGMFARLAVVGIGAVWLVDQVRDIEAKRNEAQDSDEKIDQESEDSFPASDAPSTTASKAGSPAETDS